MSNVHRADDDTWTFQCPGYPGDACGHVSEGGPPYDTSGWPTKKTAEARGAQHIASHEDLIPMQELHDFRVEQGLVAHADGVRAVKA